MLGVGYRFVSFFSKNFVKVFKVFRLTGGFCFLVSILYFSVYFSYF